MHRVIRGNRSYPDLTSTLGFFTPWTICSTRWFRWDLYLCGSYFRPERYSRSFVGLSVSEDVARI